VSDDTIVWSALRAALVKDGRSLRHQAFHAHPPLVVERFDLDAHDLLSRTLLSFGLSVISEEHDRPMDGHGAMTGPLHGLTAYLDPIDGSANVGAPAGPFGPSVAVIHHAQVVFSAVLDLRSGRVVGAGPDLPLVEPTTLEAVDVLRSSAPTPAVLLGGTGAIADAGPSSAQVTGVHGATAHDLCALALNEHSVYVDVRNTVRPWDYLGGLHVLRAAGGFCMELDGRELMPDVTVNDRGSRRLFALSPSEAVTRVEDFRGHGALS